MIYLTQGGMNAAPVVARYLTQGGMNAAPVIARPVGGAFMRPWFIYDAIRCQLIFLPKPSVLSVIFSSSIVSCQRGAVTFFATGKRR